MVHYLFLPWNLPWIILACYGSQQQQQQKKKKQSIIPRSDAVVCDIWSGRARFGNSFIESGTDKPCWSKQKKEEENWCVQAVQGPPPIGASRNRWAAWCFRGLAGDRTVLVNRLEGLSRLTLPRKSLVLVSLQGLSVIYLKLGKNPTNSEARLQNDWNNVDRDVKLQIKQNQAVHSFITLSKATYDLFGHADCTWMFCSLGVFTRVTQTD